MADAAATTRQKALSLNLDGTMYGAFAEIGAGQEVARWFFSVGGAAGTVAKTISAYDMAVSDALYGPAERYVSRQRLEAMLKQEFVQLREGLEVALRPAIFRLRRHRGGAPVVENFRDQDVTGHLEFVAEGLPGGDPEQSTGDLRSFV